MELARALSTPFYFLSGLVLRNQSRVLFGAWHGDRYADNPRFLAEFLIEAAPGLDLVWCGREKLRGDLPAGLRFVPYGSLAGLWAVLTAGTCLISHGYTDVFAWNLLRGCRLVDLGHGFAIKKMGVTTPERGNAVVRFLKSLVRRIDSRSFYAASSEEHATKLVAEFARCFIHEDKILKTGQPRLDPLFGETNTPARRAGVRRDLAERFGVPATGSLVSYLPTFRDESQRAFSFSHLTAAEGAAWAERMRSAGACIVEKGHPIEASSGGAPQPDAPWLVNLSSTPGVDTQALLIATDVLITDYSGCYLDFLGLDRPVLHFAYDYDTYMHHDRGMYYALEEVAGGAIVRTLDELGAAVARSLANPAADAPKRAALRARMLGWESGQSCRRTAEALGLVAAQDG